MKFKVTHPKTKTYIIRPYQNGLCFEIETEQKIGEKGKNGFEIKRPYVSCGFYPTTIPDALLKVLELMLSDVGDDTEIDIITGNVNQVIDQLNAWFHDIDVTLLGNKLSTDNI